MRIKLTVEDRDYIYLARPEGRDRREVLQEAAASLIDQAMEDLEPTCDRLTRRGMCNRPLDDDGNCDRAGDHIQDEFSA